MYKKFKRFIPPIVIDLVRRKSTVVWEGVYSRWMDVLSQTGTYANEEILVKISNAIQKVLDGEYPYERDGVLFDEIQYNWPLATCFAYALKEKKRALTVVDFGGSLGSTYISNRWFFDQDAVDRWIIVEQPHFVERGRQLLRDKKISLSFANDTNEVLEVCHHQKIDILLFSSVLQYLEEPYKVLEQYIDALAPAYIIIDRTTFSKSESFISLQRVGKEIVQSSYPVHFLNETDFSHAFSNKRYEKLLSFNSFCDPQKYMINLKEVCWQGFLFKRTSLL